MQITERNGKYQYREYYIEKLTGKRKRMTITLDKNTRAAQKEAAEILRAKIAEANEMLAAPEALRLGALLDMYIADQKKEYKESTTTRNEYTIRPVVEAIGSDALCSMINVQILRAALGGKDVSATTKNSRLTRVKAMFRWAYQNQLMDDISFIDRIRPYKEMTEREKVKDKFMETEDLRILLDIMNSEHNKLITKMLVLTGMRIGELAALKPSDVHIKERYIDINKTFDYVYSGKETTTKTFASKRHIYIQSELMPVLTQVKRWRLQNGKSSEFFLPDYDGGVIHVRAYEKYFRELTERVLQKRLTPHSLRHTHASICFEQGMSMEAVSERLGHASSKITREIYVHVTEKKKAEYNAQMDAITMI